MIEMSLEEALRRGWLVPGDIILTSHPSTWLAKAILAGQSLFLDRPARWTHAMRYVGDGQVISQDWKVALRPLTDWRGADLRVWHCLDYTSQERQRLVEEARLDLGRPYDLLGLLGQAFRAVPFVGRWLAGALEIPWLTFCSEKVCHVERTINPAFLDLFSGCQVAPQDIDDWCNARRRESWREHTFRLV